MTRTSRRPASFLVVVEAMAVYAIWASTWPVGKLALSFWTPAGLTCIRHVLAGVLLVGLGRLLGDSLRLPSRAETAIGLLQYASYYLFSYKALASGSTAVTAVVVALYPVIVMIFSLNATSLRLQGFLAAILGAAGCGLIVMGSTSDSGLDIQLPSVALALFAALAQAASTLIRREPATPSKIIGFTGRSMFVGGVASGALVLVSGDRIFQQEPGVLAVSTLMWLSLMGSAVTFVAVEYLLRRWRPVFVSISYFSVPCLAVVMAHVFLNEAITFSMTLGIGLCLAAIFLSARSLGGSNHA